MPRETKDPVAKIGSAARPSPVAVGDYLYSERELYRIEDIVDGHVLIEDCRTAELFDLMADELSLLHRLERD